MRWDGLRVAYSPLSEGKVNSNQEDPCVELSDVGLRLSTMTLKIDKATGSKLTVFALSGCLEAEQTSELTRLLELETNQQGIVLDLKEIRLVDRDAIKFLIRCEAHGIKLKNPPAYVREWITREREMVSANKHRYKGEEE
jgi:hypothetical protein